MPKSSIPSIHPSVQLCNHSSLHPSSRVHLSACQSCISKAICLQSISSRHTVSKCNPQNMPYKQLATATNLSRDITNCDVVRRYIELRSTACIPQCVCYMPVSRSLTVTSSEWPTSGPQPQLEGSEHGNTHLSCRQSSSSFPDNLHIETSKHSKLQSIIDIYWTSHLFWVFMNQLAVSLCFPSQWKQVKYKIRMIGRKAIITDRQLTDDSI